MKKAAVLSVLLLLFFFIAALFWHNEWVYSLPTPIPDNYKAVAFRERIFTPGLSFNSQKPVFLHFFNPDCPCSKFNVTHFRSLVKEYGEQVDFAVVVLSDNKNYTANKIQEKFHLSIPVVFDTSLAGNCGVYSTPQAVILDKDRKLFYRGNYNKSRYCTDKKTNYASIALDSLLGYNDIPVFDRFALNAYGCELPNCRK